MDKKDNNMMSAEYYTIDLLHIVKRVWHYIWAVALASLIAAGIGFSYATFFIAPTYSSSVMLYVNNNSISVGGANFTINASQLSASQALVNTYTEILKNRTTLTEVGKRAGLLEKYEENQLYSYLARTATSFQKARKSEQRSSQRLASAKWRAVILLKALRTLQVLQSAILMQLQVHVRSDFLGFPESIHKCLMRHVR